ncbi:MAG TPA: carbohydrate ABC transporter permease [Fimbriimonadaceae bacterium]|nr:carbohydrate ABC transporter permease [Fimbriimonadaceae bacterium]
MSLVGKVGRRSFRSRLAMVTVYGILALGAITTLYPFTLMVMTGFKGSTDQNDNKLVPAFWSNLDEPDATGAPAPESLLGKYLADKYAGDASMIASTRVGSKASEDEIRQYREFLEQLPVEYWAAGFRTAANQSTSKLTMRYQSWLRGKYPSITALNKAYIEENAAFQTVVPPSEMLERKVWKAPNSRKYREWLEFKAALPHEFRIPVREQRLFQEFLRSKFENQMDRVPPAVKGSATKFEAIPVVDSPLLREFRAKSLPDQYRWGAADNLWKREHRTTMPVEAYERAHVAAQQTELKREFSTRNYRFVLDYILLNGRALWNTFFFVVLVIIAQLSVNTLAAYALSRYPVRASAKILIFLLATMAFPAEVAMIPNFLLLKDLGLLNTFAALVLPTAASGYMIFLLKGFFDSLPQELFESGQIDGAKETTMMTKIALPLSKPVLGYMALLAFSFAYGTFLYAFLVAQDQRVWTIMVWIYQLQLTAPKSVMMAALTLAALPSLIVFLFAQRVIMRGIILPGER